MYDIHPISDKPILLEPPQKEPNNPPPWISRLITAVNVLLLLSVVAYLVGTWAFSLGNTGCSYDGDIPIHEAFLPIYEQHCLTIGAPISRIGQEDIPNYGPRTIQYFEGALLMTDLAGNLSATEFYPLGSNSLPAEMIPAPASENGAFLQYWAEIGENPILGERLTDLVLDDEFQVVYFENGALQWHSLRKAATPFHLGRVELYSSHPQLMINAAIIPNDERLTTIFGDVPEYEVTSTLLHPVLYSGDQQVVTLEVINSITNVPITDLTLSGVTYFDDLGADLNETFLFEPTELPGVYTAVINLPAHPDGNGGRDVSINISILGSDPEASEALDTIQKFQTWW